MPTINISSNLEKIDNGATKAEIQDIISRLNNAESYLDIRYDFFYFNEVLPNTNPGVSYFDNENYRTVGIGFNLDEDSNEAAWEIIFPNPLTRPSFTGVYNGTVVLDVSQVNQLFNFSANQRSEELFGVGGAYHSLITLPNNIKLALEDLYYNGGPVLTNGKIKTYLTNYKNAVAQNDTNAANAALIAARDEILKESNLKLDNGLANRRLKEAALLMMDAEVKQPQSEIQQLINAAFDRKKSGDVIRVDGNELKHRTDYIEKIAEKLNITVSQITSQLENQFLASREKTLENGQKIYAFEDNDLLKFASNTYATYFLRFASDSSNLEQNAIKVEIPQVEVTDLALLALPEDMYEIGRDLEVKRGSQPTVNMKYYDANLKEALEESGGAINFSFEGGVIELTEGILVDKSKNTNIGSGAYNIVEFLDSTVSAGEAVGKFINAQIDNAMEWFTNGGVGSIQVDIANWLAGNLQNIINGNLSADEAFIDLAEYVAQQRISGYVIGTISDATQAKTALADMFSAAGATGDAKILAGAVQTAIAQMAVQFALNSEGWDGEQYANAGITIISSALAYEYGAQYFGSAGAGAAGAAAAAATVVNGLLNSQGYGQTEWIMLGVQTGIAAGSAVAGTIIAEKIIGAAISTGNPVVIAAAAVIAAVIAITGGKVVENIYKGKVYYEGEYGDPSLVFQSIYQVQNITVNGQQVQALMAVNALGSTIIAQGINHIVGGSGSDVLVDDAGIDNYIMGNGGSDYLESRAGNDALMGGEGNDHLNGGAGDDILQGDNGDDLIFGEEGVDTMLGGAGDDFMHAGSDDDIVSGGDGRDNILAGGGEDAITGDAGDDTIDGGFGNDGISGGDGNDIILANLGNDSVNGDAGADTIFGDEGNDTIYGDDGNDMLDGGAGTDILSGDNGNDILTGGADNDFLNGGLGEDSLLGGDGDDSLVGGMDNDYLMGDAGDDLLDGGNGADILEGGYGADTMQGGDGNDVYVVTENALDADNIIIESGDVAIGGFDSLYLQWAPTAPFSLSNLHIVKDGDDVKISYESRVLATVKDYFLNPQHSMERIEIPGAKYIDLSSVVFDSGTGIGSFMALDLNYNYTPGTVAARQDYADDNVKSQELYWNDSYLEKLSQIAYDEKLREETDNIYYNGTQVQGFFRNRGKFGGKYTVYKLDAATHMNGTEESIKYVVMDDEDQTSAALFGVSKTALPGPYENLHYNAIVHYSSFAGKWIQDIKINGTVVQTRVENDNTNYAAGATVQGATYAQRQNAGYDIASAIATKILGGDQLVGGYWNETIDGKSGNDILVANDGNDLVYGGTGDDWLFGGDGVDSLWGGANADVMFGGAGNDSLYGEAEEDAILAGDGLDFISGGDGNDWLDGGKSVDTINGDNGNDIILGDEGNDILSGGSGNDILHGNEGDDEIYGGDGDDYIYGGEGQDLLDGGAGNDVIDGGGGRSSLNGGDGIDRISFKSSAVALVLNAEEIFNQDGAYLNETILNFEELGGTEFGDLITGFTNQVNGLFGNGGDDMINGGNLNDIIKGDAGHDTIQGLAGNDTIYGGTGNDNMQGAAGDDFIHGEDGNDIIDGGSGLNNLIGGNGTDRLNFLSSTAGININIAQIISTNGASIGQMISGFEEYGGSNYNDVINIGNSGLSLNTIYGYDGDDAVYDGNGNDNMFGGNGNDTLVAGAGDDLLDGGLGADSLYGGYSGWDTAYYGFSNAAVNVNLASNVNTGGYAEGDMIYNIIHVSGSGYNDIIAGNSANNGLFGGAGDDRLMGDAGNDYLEGHEGTDIVSYINSAAAVVVNLATNSYSGGFAAGDTLLNIENIEASNLNDTITGNAINNILWGKNGNDALSGGDGNDILQGGTGNDNLNGGNGIDTARYNESAASVNINMTTSSYSGGDAAGDTLTGIENIDGSIYNDIIRGNASANAIWGDDGNDEIYGGAGDDTISGWLGNNTLVGDDGNDTINGYTGNDTIYGGIGNDTIFSYGGTDNIFGGDGNDILVSGSGADSMNGEAGSDNARYTQSTAAVIINLLTGAYSGGYAQGDTLSNIENIDGSTHGDTLTGNNSANGLWGDGGDDIIYGNGGDDSISGWTGNNTLYGGDGNDTINGWTGTDIINGDAGNDTLKGYDNNDIIQGGAGNDNIDGGNGIDTARYTDSNAAININLATNTHSGGDAAGDILTNIEGIDGSIYADTITGNSSANFIWGDDGNDTIYGGAGDDNISGWLGNNTLVGDDGNDTINGWTGNDTIYGGSGNDTIYSYGGTDNIFAGSGNDIIIGDDGNDSIYGEDGNDLITASGGVDTIYGGANSDVFIFGATTDSITSGRDVIKDFAIGADKIQISAAIANSFNGFSFANSGSDLIINDIDSSFSIKLENIASVSANDFIFS